MAVFANRSDLQKRARLAGFLFLFVNALYIVSLILTAREIVAADIGATARNLAASETIYRTGAALQVLACALTILMSGAFYALLRAESPVLSLVALACRVAEAALFGVTAILAFVVLDIATAPEAAAQVSAWRWMLAAQRTVGIVGQVYFCLGSGIFFYLLFRSQFIPRALSVFGAVATLLSLISSLATLIVPERAGPLDASALILLAAETLVGFWLLVRGVSEAREPTAVAFVGEG